MSLSHSAGRQQLAAEIHGRFTEKSGESGAAVWKTRHGGTNSLRRNFGGGGVFLACMSRFLFTASAVAGLGLCLASATAQQYSPAEPNAGAPPDARAYAGLSPVPLGWTPPALAQLSTLAAMKTNFTLDRNMLGMAAAVLPDEDAEARQTLRKLDGVSVHLLRFGQAGMVDPAAMDAIRAAYHLRGWKHLVTATNAGGPVRNDTTDVWLVLDGVTVKGAVVLAETPKSVTLVTIAGNLDPVDVMHLRGHFGIPRFEKNQLHDAPVQ